MEQQPEFSFACDPFQEEEGGQSRNYDAIKASRPRFSKKRRGKENEEERKKEGKRETSDKARPSNRFYPSRTYRLAYERPLGGLDERIVK